jgi:hypothetical protein
MKKISKFWQLDSTERNLLMKTFLLLNLVRFLFLFLQFPRLQKILTKLGTRRSSSNGTLPLSVKQIVWAIELSTQFSPGGAKCLARALTMQTLMQQQGYDSQLQIGVIHQPTEEFQAHAWIEYQGEIVIGMLPDLEKYKALHPV